MWMPRDKSFKEADIKGNPMTDSDESNGRPIQAPSVSNQHGREYKWYINLQTTEMTYGVHDCPVLVYVLQYYTEPIILTDVKSWIQPRLFNSIQQLRQTTQN